MLSFLLKRLRLDPATPAASSAPSTSCKKETTSQLAEVAVYAGFSDQSQFCLHFKRLVGVTPRQFRTHARIA
jgi:AraC-like DNA-binding protein